MIYFAGLVPDGPIKIGSAIEPKERVNSLSLPYPIEILAITGGGRAEEFALHGHFAANKLRGEWFERNERLQRS